MPKPLTNSTKLKGSSVEPGSISNITGAPIKFSNIVYADETYTETANTSFPSTGNGYFIITGTNLSDVSNVIVGTTEVTLNTASSSEVRAEFPVSILTVNQTYDVSVYGDSGTFAMRKNALNSYAVPLSSYGYTSMSWPNFAQYVQRFDFSSDSSNMVFASNLYQGQGRGSATGNDQYAYWIGGTDPSYFSAITRTDYSNDTATSLLRAQTGTSQLYYTAATGNLNDGWFDTAPNESNVKKLNYADDTTTTPIRAAFSSGVKYQKSAAGNLDYGWWAGGYPVVSSVDRVDYSNDTQTPSSRGNLTATSSSGFAISNINFGWHHIGNTSYINKINYSNDTTTASSLSTTLGICRNRATFGTLDYGYFASGIVNSSSSSIIHRLDFSTDDLSLRGNIGILAQDYLSGTGGFVG